MRRFLQARRARPPAVAPAAGTPSGEWYDEVLASASANGAFPYVVEGYVEIYEAVRRGDAVLLKREPATVAEGITVFGDASAAGVESGVVTVSSFDLRTARFVVQDPATAVGRVELTPKRLQRYVAEPSRCVGVALG